MKNMNRDRIFIAVVAIICLGVLIFAPALKITEKLGWVRLPKLGNIIEPEHVYEGTGILSSALSVIEYAKADISDTYTNYLPAYAEFTSFVQTKQVDFNQGFNDFLSSFIKKPAPAPDAGRIDMIESGAPETTAAPAETKKPPEKTGEASSIIGTDWGDITVSEHRSRFLKKSGDGLNVYAVDATLSDGSEISLLTTAFSTPPATYTKRMKEQAALINAICAANTDVNVYVYVCSRLQDSECFPDIIPGEPSTHGLVLDFFDLLDDRIKYGRLAVDSLQDSINKLFLTDHHWNAYGMYEAYCDIVNMMRADSPSIAEPRPIGKRYDIEEADFYGTFARVCGYYNYKDNFFFYDYDLPRHTLVASNPYDFEKRMSDYLAGKFGRDMGADHYVNFYPYSEYLKYPDNKTGRRLLLLGDSYSRGISELLASSFDEAYIFDYRRIHQIGSYNDYIEKHGITDVLFLQYSLRGVFDNQNDNTLGTLILD